jgi:Fe-S oxidoreductase
MSDRDSTPREGSLEAPTRHAIDWRSAQYTDAKLLEQELERVFDICHGCRRCFNLCNAFPTLFDAVDESETGEVDSVPKSAFADVVDHCYLCDMCYMSKCPYVPPHEWNIDFPHLMLRAKHRQFKETGASSRDKLLSSTETVGSLAGIPVVSNIVNAVNSTKAGRSLLEKTLGVDAQAPMPRYHSNTARKRLSHLLGQKPASSASAAQDRVLVFTTCYGNRNQPQIVEDLAAILEHNDVTVALPAKERCCGMPKLELGDLESVEQFKNENIEELDEWARAGWLITAAVPSCVLMFRQELRLLFPDDERVQRVAAQFRDPFEYLMELHRGGRLATEFVTSLGSISYQVPCHLRVQNLGLKTRDVLALVPDTKVKSIERCSGHDGTYGVKKEFAATSRKIARPVARQADSAGADYFTSDCPMAGAQVATVAESVSQTHPLTLLRKAYGI